MSNFKFLQYRGQSLHQIFRLCRVPYYCERGNGTIPSKVRILVQGISQYITPDELYHRYQNFVSLLLNDTGECFSHLLVLYLNTLLSHLKYLIVSQGYKLHRFSGLDPTVLQKHKLEILREKIVTTKFAFKEERKRMNVMVSFLLSHRYYSYHPSSCINSHFISTDSQGLADNPLFLYGSGRSIAKQTIANYRSGFNRKSIVTINDGMQHLKNPKHEYISKQLAIFNGCLGCGQVSHHQKRFHNTITFRSTSYTLLEVVGSQYLNV